MKRFILLIVLVSLFSPSLHPFRFSLAEVLGLLKKISMKMSDYNDLMGKYAGQFEDFFQTRWARYYSKPSVKKGALFSESGDPGIYRGAHVNPGEMAPRWKRVFANPSLLKDEFPFIFNFDVLRDGLDSPGEMAAGKGNRENIADAREYLAAVQKVLTLMADTRRLQARRGEKVRRIREYIKNFAMPQGRDEVRMGRLIALETAIEHEIHKQYVELITLINAGTEINVKSTVMAENFRNRNHRRRLTGKVR